ncbi:hypothetical protein IW152_005203 [Coemansia sp. BCRC 34962]|nr:hypothetical protein IW152_005203 [Coemansia sp. BCRC 34962]
MFKCKTSPRDDDESSLLANENSGTVINDAFSPIQKRKSERTKKKQQQDSARDSVDNSIWKITQPVDAQLRRLAEDVTDLVAVDIEQHLKPYSRGEQPG